MSHRHQFEKWPSDYIEMAGYRVFFHEFPNHGWCWSRAKESHHSEPGVHWFGPFPHRTAALLDAEEQKRKRWRIFRKLSLPMS